MAWGDLAAELRRSGLSPDRPPWAGLSDDPLPPAEREAVLQAIIADLDDRGNASAVIRSLSAEASADARRLAVEIAARLPKIDPILIAWLRPLLRDRRMPSKVLVEGAAALLRTSIPTAENAARILRDFAAGYGRKRVLRQRKNLRERLGIGREFDRLCADLKRTIPMRCPRCGVRRRRRAMEHHLWRRHHLLLVNGRVRSPLRWLDQLSSRRAVGSDADTALDIVSQHMSLRRLPSKDAESARLAIASRRSADICPHCTALVARQPAVISEPIRPLTISNDRISGEEWIVEQTNAGIGSGIRILERDGSESQFGNSAGRWSQTPALRWLVLPWVVLAFVLAAALPPEWAILGTAIALTGAYAWRLLVRAFAEPPTADALVDAAWRGILQPSLQRDETPWAFAARLAVSSANLGSARLRGNIVRTVVDRSQVGGVTSVQRAALLGLLLRDAGKIGDDPLPLLLDAMTNALAHDRPIDELEPIVDCTPWREWSVGRRTRFRIALIDRAFAAGLGVWELIELGTVIPTLGDWIAVGDLDGLARLRGLWLLRSDRGWEACGPAATAFELATYPVHEDTLAAAPDLLLEAPVAKDRERVWLRGCGLSFRGATIHQPAPIEIHIRPLGRGYELKFGTRRFRFEDDASELAHTLTALSRYHFDTLLPAMDGALGIPDGAVLERLLKSKTVACPECNGMFRVRTTVLNHERLG